VALDPPWQAAIAAATWLVCFPVALLSALEQSSAFAVVSPRILYSLVRCAGPWLLFVVETLVVGAGVGYLLLRAVAGSRAFFYLVPWLATAAVLLYMRLIGRLAWWIADMMPAVEDEPE
jgi:hypothetical protein